MMLEDGIGTRSAQNLATTSNSSDVPPRVTRREGVPRESTATVLAVDGREEGRHLLRSLLAPSFDVVEAASTADAIVRARRPGLECVLVVHRPPDVDGIGLVAELRDLGIGVVVLAETPGAELLRECLRTGAHDCLDLQSLGARSLMLAIRRAIHRTQNARELAMVRRLVERMPLGAVVLERGGDTRDSFRSSYLNPTGREVWADGADEPLPGLGSEDLWRHCQRVLETGQVSRVPRIEVADQVYEAQISRLDERRVLLLLEDVTELLRTQAQLEASSRMEAVGRLAGGVAHDFNNMLTVIKGHAGFVLDATEEQDPVHQDAVAILDAASRSGELTKQLLAFSRRQIRAPRVLELNRAVRSLETLLNRIIGEDLVLRDDLATDLGAIEADPTQIEQILMNLVVNARDAMPKGGTLEIRTRNQTFETRQRPAKGFQIPPGAYVELLVSDQGIGMDEDTLTHMFEPFFTTKSQDEGTGLGLATVYGIVKQSGGFVWAESVLGEGSTFHVLLPRVASMRSEAPDPQAPRKSMPGGETILLVEDERLVRRAIKRILKGSGYKVIEAERGSDALELALEHDGSVDLLLTDVVMPGLDGRALADALSEIRPTCRVLFMSGYTDDKIVEASSLAPDTPFVGKPFTREALLEAVGDALQTGPALADMHG